MTQPKEPTFEEAIGRLGHIVQELERGDLPLEQSLSLFEEGVRLSRLSQARLDGAEKRLDELLSVGPDGQPRTRPLSSSADDEA